MSNNVADLVVRFINKVRRHSALIRNIVTALGITILVTLPLYFYSELDKGGLLSLAVTVALVTILPLIKGKRPEDIVEFFREKDVPYAFVTFVLMGATFIGLWLTIRKTGLLAKLYVLDEGYLYNQYEILEVLSYILATRLCFTLFKTFETIGIAEIVDTAVQAVLITIITLLPKYEDTRLLETIGGFWGFVFVLLSMATLLISLAFVREKIKE